ncbi:sugar ABC transporter substrate-binding protein [Niallia endozanthoxylica]|uniref:sugar ABC transporter substrate-binding protein n=1 Tax=Niallia endozanthoxylica TaxID=2036016 RepID=UPI00168BA4A6|nr:sugar ABC transporter substrate-binding protein [Niallia endozanthoxylica]
MKKRWIILLVSIIPLIALISLAFQEDKPKVIVVLQRLDIEYWKAFESGAKKAFNDFNIDGEVISPDSLYPVTNQPNLLKKVLKQNPDALIVSTTHPSVGNPVLMEYKKKNIPVFLTTTDVEWEYQASYIGTDNIALGETAGMLLGSMLYPGDQVAIILGRLDDQTILNQRNGAKKVLEDVGIKIVAEPLGYDKFGNPRPVMENILRNYPNLKGVVATTDRIALEALKEIEEKGLRIPIVGTDGLTKMAESVGAGKISATVGHNPYDMGYLSVEQAGKVLSGEHIEKRIDSGIDIITEDNAKERLDFLKKILD